MINTSADLTGIGNYMGVVGGMIKAMEDPRFQGDFVQHLMSKTKKVFMTETIAANLSGAENLQHVFEWGGQSPNGVATGTPSNIPLFRLFDRGGGREGLLTYEFLPSMKPVPLPDPGRYGFKASILNNLGRHVFQLKALIMETQSNVTIDTVGAKRLFIPSETAKRGYVMTNKSVNVNPGGTASTGQFGNWWMNWFSTRAPEVVNAEAQLTEQFLGATGQKLVRYAAGTRIGGVNVGGRFASSKGVSMSYVNAKEETIKKEVLSASEKYFDEDAWSAQWDE